MYTFKVPVLGHDDEQSKYLIQKYYLNIIQLQVSCEYTYSEGQKNAILLKNSLNCIFTETF